MRDAAQGLTAGEGLVEVVGGAVFGAAGVKVEVAEDRLVEEFPGVVGGGVVEVSWLVG